MKPNSSIKIFSLYFFVVIVFLLVFGTLSSIYTYKKVSERAQEILLKNTESIAGTLEVDDIISFLNNESDLENPAYLSLKRKLEKIPKINEDIRFVYLWGHREGNPYFLVDSEPTTSPDYSPPGQIFHEATEIDHDMFLKRLPATLEISTDRWGTWLTALAPIKNEETGDLVAVMGMDMSAEKYFATLYAYTAIPALTTVFILVLMIIGFMLRKREQQFLTFKSELLSIASHEIRSPLTGISWLTNGILRNSENLSKIQKEDIGIIKNKIDGLIFTINNLLDVAAVEKKNKKNLIKKPIIIKALFEEIIKDFSLIFAEKNNKLILDGSVNSEIVLGGDYETIKRMFNNLVSNAVKYSKKEGTIVLGAIDKKDKFVFWVKDEGIGIVSGDQDKLFEKFFRGENAKKVTDNGAGLGLPYVKQAAELHGGKVWCESRENEGSIFYVELPKR